MEDAHPGARVSRPRYMVEYFKELAEETGIPYQNLINLYLRDCVRSGRKPALEWR